ncbi:glycoside hydrolase family 2 protein [Xylogone sp. PMI_703]|nr:glycoside hydrolase family 2 protein [Xylogone sp. PMI_703]
MLGFSPQHVFIHRSSLSESIRRTSNYARTYPYPTKDLNSDAIQWVGEQSWLYRTIFDLNLDSGNKQVALVLEGLDTHASILLNGELLLKTDNMFLEYRVDKLEKEQGFKNLFWNGDSSCMNVRKVPCHYGWDWGPTLLTCGPWRPIYLEVYSSRISDLFVDVEVDNGLKYAILSPRVEIEQDRDLEVEITLLDPSGSLITTKAIKGGSQCQFMVGEPQLWYPHGYGLQPLYSVVAKIKQSDSDKVLDCKSRKVGVRLSELVQRPVTDQSGTTFFFRINNIPIYCQGTNWIPADTFLPRLTPQRYRKWLELAVESNQNMIRVWGGGLYEDDVFYDICGEFGILIWQDFMLGCAEAIYNVKRMRNHPCIVLWCGNNEDHMFAELHHLEYDQTDQNEENWLKDICTDLTPRTPYHFSSPWGGSYSNDPLVGDIHSWRVWMADQPRYPYQKYPELSGRFVSEFGMKSYPSIKTINELISDPNELYPQSKTMDSWHMAPEDQPTIALYLIDHFKHKMTLESYTYTTQLLQSEAMSYAVRGWRRLWKGPNHEECAGNLIWQLNDCFPAVSWSLVNSAPRPKLAYYTTKRNYASVTVGISRRLEVTPKNEFTHVDVTKVVKVEIWGSNLTIDSLDAELIERTKSNISIAPNRSTDLQIRVLPENEEPVIVSARISRGDNVIARYADWPQPLKYLSFARDAVKVDVKGENIEISSTAPVKGLELFVDDEDVIFDNNCLDVVPDDVQMVNAKCLGRKKLQWRHLS